MAQMRGQQEKVPPSGYTCSISTANCFLERRFFDFVDHLRGSQSTLPELFFGLLPIPATTRQQVKIMSKKTSSSAPRTPMTQVAASAFSQQPLASMAEKFQQLASPPLPSPLPPRTLAGTTSNSLISPGGYSAWV